MKRLILFIIVVALILFGLYRWGKYRENRVPDHFTPATQSKLTAKQVPGLAALDNEYTTLVKAVVPSVVCITTSRRVHLQVNPFYEQFYRQMFGLRIPKDKIENSLGSGVIVSKEGDIITNYHVIKNVDEIRVQLHDGRIVPAKLLGSDPQSDLAVLKIDAGKLSPLAFADSSKVQAGEMVFAIGNPFGFQETVTNGIISAKGRRTSDDSTNEYLQTDAAINPGNSGGPLVDLHGNIVGINSSIYSRSGSGWQGIGFAIPSNVVKHALLQIIKKGHVEHGYLGLRVQELTPTLAEQFGVKNQKGVLVSEVTTGAPAQKSGLNRGDIIQKFAGFTISDPQDLRSRMADVNIGAQVKMQIVRNGKKKTLTVTVAEQPADAVANGQASGNQPSAPGSPSVLTGIHTIAIPAAQVQNLPVDVQGVMVSQIDPASAAAKVLSPGDVIEQINRQPITSVQQFKKVVASLSPKSKPLLSICRGKTRLFVVVQAS